MNSDGSVDTAFSDDLYGNLNEVVLQTDGKILIGGSFQTAGAFPRTGTARLNTDGSTDNGFDPECSNDVTVIAVQADGKI